MVEFPTGNTIGELYKPAMEIDNEADAQFYLGKLIERRMLPENGGYTEEDARALELSNLGYYSGYYDNETFERVNRLFKAVHPIFGGVYPTDSNDTLAKGIELGKQSKE